MGARSTASPSPAAAPRLFGLLAEFETPAELLRAARAVRDAGFTRWDCHSPFPVHGLDRAMGLRDTPVAWIVLFAGMTGSGAAILMQWWMSAVDYRLIISGKPLFSLPAQIPIAFELTVLFAALSAFASVFVLNGLPQFYHPTFRSRRFARATNDRFFVSIEATDPRFAGRETEQLLRSLGSRHVEWLEE
jgi:hypothetical protein